jgi:hypothetical protein
MDGPTSLKAEFSNVGSVCLQDGMQKVRDRILLVPALVGILHGCSKPAPAADETTVAIVISCARLR